MKALLQINVHEMTQPPTLPLLATLVDAMV